MTDANEIAIVWPKPKFPDTTPHAQSFTAEQLGVDATPHGIRKEGGTMAQNDLREFVAEEMNKETLLCPTDKFLGHYGPGPKMDATTIKKCRKFLIKEKILNAETGRWTAFPIDPSMSEKFEAKLFKLLKPIVDKVFEFAEGMRKNNYKFEVVGDNHLESDIPGTNHRADGCLVDPEYVRGDGEKMPVRFVRSPQQYKKVRAPVEQREVRIQLVGDAHHILCEDPTRMFIIGVTFEDRRMSLWYFSRSHSVKALSFDWVEQDIDLFIAAFLGFACATPKELGVDETVFRAPLTGKGAAQQYIYRCPVDDDAGDASNVQDGVRKSARLAGPKYKYFKTVQSINDMRPYNISGRNTRIWKVVEVKGLTNEEVTGEIFVLKDVWLEAGTKTEAENMDLIFAAIRELVKESKKNLGADWSARLVATDPRFTSFDGPTKSRLQHFLTDENYKSLFLTKLEAWKGETSKTLCTDALNSRAGNDIFPAKEAVQKPGKVCRTEVGSLARSGVPLSEGQATRSGLMVLPPASNDGKKGQKNAAAEQKKRRRFAPKQQSRFVYKEVCADLETVGTLGNFMDLIDQALDALRILFCAGWMHRDISSSNLLAFNDDGKWKIKLADLEFAEMIGYKSKRGDPRTGTPFFMAFEIMKKEYLVDTLRECRDPEASMAARLGLDEGTPEYDLYKTFDAFGTRTNRIPSTATPDIPEPLATVRYNFQHDLESLWWIVLYFITAIVDHQKSQEFANLVFKRALKPSGDRRDVWHFKFDTQVKRHLEPKLATAFTPFMERLRTFMYEAYQARAMFGQLTVSESYSAVHGFFATQFRNFLDTNEGNWKQTPIAPRGNFSVTFYAGSKRGFDDEAAETTDRLKKIKLDAEQAA